MKKLLSLFILTVLSISFVPSVALAAKPVNGGGLQPAPTIEYVGYDVSYPQCGRKLPTDHYFGIVGVNGGNASTPNGCLADQLVWASKAKTGSNQSKKQVYVNTANPGQVISQVSTWPKTAYDLNGNLLKIPMAMVVLVRMTKLVRGCMVITAQFTPREHLRQLQIARGLIQALRTIFGGLMLRL